jgi:hypothetical protein
MDFHVDSAAFRRFVEVNAKLEAYPTFRLLSFITDGWWVFTELGSVLRGEFLLGLGIALETLRFGSQMFLAPIPFLLEVRRDLGIAHAANVLGNAMLSTPPTMVGVSVAGRSPMTIIGHRGFNFCGISGCSAA